MHRRWQKLNLDQSQGSLFEPETAGRYYQPGFNPATGFREKTLKQPPVFLITELYCQNEDCPVRTSEVLTKILGPSFPTQPAEDEWFCPHCKTPAKPLWTLEPAEYRKRYGEFRDIALEET